MALVQAARFYTLSEAEVAASMLRSAGIAATISDIHYGSVFWLEQNALGGFRLSVPEEEWLDAAALLSAPPPMLDAFDAYEPVEPLSNGRRALAGVLGLALGPAAGWLATGRRRGAALGEILSGTLIAGGVLVLAGLVLFYVANLLFNPP